MPEHNLPDKMYSLLRPLIPGTLSDSEDCNDPPRKRSRRTAAKSARRQLERSPGVPYEFERVLNAAWVHTEPVGSVLVR